MRMTITNNWSNSSNKSNSINSRSQSEVIHSIKWRSSTNNFNDDQFLQWTYNHWPIVTITIRLKINSSNKVSITNRWSQSRSILRTKSGWSITIYNQNWFFQ
jgi:hypothetical protein